MKLYGSEENQSQHEISKEEEIKLIAKQNQDRLDEISKYESDMGKDEMVSVFPAMPFRYNDEWRLDKIAFLKSQMQ